MSRLGEIASVLRSKNAGPFMTTIDIFFPEFESYRRVRDAKIVTPRLVADIYKLSEDQVLGVHWHDQAAAVKITFLKPFDTSDPRCTDIYGAQQHVPIALLEVD